MLEINRRIRLWTFPLRACVLVLLLLSAALAQNPLQPSTKKQAETPPATRSAAATEFAYFFNLTGDFEKISLVTGEEVAHGQVPPAVGVVRPLQRSGFDGCVFCSARYDSHLGRLYAVMAKEARGSDDNTKNFKIFALDLPGMKTSASIEVGSDEPIELLTRDGHTLVTSYQSSSKDEKSNELSFGLSIYSAPSLKLLQTIRENIAISSYIGGAVIKTKLSEQAYFGEDGKTIYDQFSKSELEGNKITRGEINPSELLAKSGDKLLEPFRQVNPQTKTFFFDVDYCDSAAGKALVALNPGKNVAQGVMAVDLESKSLSPIIKLAQVTVSTAHLTPDGSQILIEDSELRHPAGAKPDEPQEAIFRTGKLSIFDTATGAKVREITASDLSGFDSRLICISPDGRLAFIAKGGHLFDVNLGGGTISQKRTSPGFFFDRWTQCLMADR